MVKNWKRERPSRCANGASKHQPQWIGVLLLAVASVHADAVTDEAADEDLENVTVHARRVAGDEPAASFATPVTVLRYDPGIDLQSRGLTEGQADASVRGGLFENTGLKVGAVTLFDPQTGHYLAEVPIDPVMLSAPVIVTGIDNALSGFNSNVATLNFSLAPLTTGGRVALGVGSDAHRYRTFRMGQTLARSANADIGAEVFYARSTGDGTRPNGDHDMERFGARLQRRSSASQTDLLIGYQDKFYGWPGAYTGFASLAETDHSKTTLVLLNHRVGIADDETGWFEVGAYYRTLDDDYDFDRTTTESGVAGAFEHKTANAAVGLQGLQPFGRWRWRYGFQLTADELRRSTDLTEGQFNSRTYLSASVVPERSWRLSSERDLRLRIGATLDASNRDSNAVSPLLGLSLTRNSEAGVDGVSLDYTGTSQVPGYTVLNSRPSGLFGGNASLGRERSDSFSLTLRRERARWQATAAVFFRKDDDLIDWTYLEGAPFARQANAVDVDVFGIEAIVIWRFSLAQLVAGYSYLDKDADYGAALVDASFYVENYARHRVTAALEVEVGERLTFRWDNAYRRQPNNVLRSGSDDAYVTSMALSWRASGDSGLQLSLIVDNLTNSDFQSFPGTPAVKRHSSIKIDYTW